jgi:glycine/D-amino acid oxidase-like deaminating enzyme
MPAHPRVVIVGAGIIGASVAWHLARQGAGVTVIEAGEPGGVATRNSWAWIIAGRGDPEPYFRLRLRAMEEWHRLGRDLPELRIAWPGSLGWQLEADELEVLARQHTAWGYDIRPVGRAEARRIEPHVVDLPDLVLHAPQEGVIEPLPATRLLLSAAQGRGVAVIADAAVRSIEVSGGRVTGVRTTSSHLEADRVIIAAGASSPALAATAGVVLPVADPPALLVVTRPHVRLLNGLVLTPALELRQTADGRFAAATTLADSDLLDEGAAAAARAVDAIERLLGSPESPVVDFHVVGRRPIPSDRMPIVGQAFGIDGLHVVVTHSGITLAAALGRFVADEVMTGRREPLLAPFGLERLRA